MKAFTVLILVIMMVFVSIVVFPSSADGNPLVGVKKGDWIEYTVNITGPTSAPAHNITWFRIEILDVEGAAFQANVTVRNDNGTLSSSNWKFNLTEGQVEGWVIIPANLGVGNTFYDSSKPANITIMGEEQKIVAGATRTITHASDSTRPVKEWDKATGVYTYSVEHPKNFTVISQAIATNMWSPQIVEQNQTSPNALMATSILIAVLVASSIILVARRNRLRKLTLSHPLQGKIAVLTIIAAILVTIGAIAFFPFSEVGLSFAEINLIMQTLWTGLILVSMWIRFKGNYFVHEITMLIAICALLVSFSAVLFMGPLTSSSAFSSSPSRLVMNSLHGIFSIPALVFGVWLVALWRPGSKSFAVKSNRIAQLTMFFWIPSYVVGVLDFMMLHTPFFG
jgi:uncharacterized membrane protein YozB (DUF420 family)